jgi:hypothetical protein
MDNQIFKKASDQRSRISELSKKYLIFVTIWILPAGAFGESNGPQ